MTQVAVSTWALPELEVPRCPLCGDDAAQSIYAHARERLFGLPGDFGVVECRSCGLVRTSPRPTPRAIGRYYPDGYISYSPPPGDGDAGAVYRGARSLARLPHRLAHGPELPDFLPPLRGAAALDVGCGAGAELVRLAGLGWEVYGVEPHVGSALRVRSELGLGADRILATTAEEAEFAPGTFHFVRLNHVLEHLHDPVRVVQSIYAWLAPGGEVRVTVPNFASRERRFFRDRWFGLQVPQHLFHFTPATLTATLAAAGLSVRRLRFELMPASLEGSISLVLAERRGGRPYVHARRVYLAAVPVASLLSPFGWSSVITAIARKT